MKRDFSQFEIKNRKAEHEYFLVEKLQAGIVLSGSEIKSIRYGSANLNEAYCMIEQGDLWLKGMHISDINKPLTKITNLRAPENCWSTKKN